MMDIDPEISFERGCAAAPPSISYEAAGGTVPGRDHRSRGRNNQDAYTWGEAGGALVAVVADGCGSSPGSEVGARVGAHLLRESCLRNAASLRAGEAGGWLEARRREVLARLRALARAMGGAGGYAAAVQAHLLFTVQAAVLTPACSLVAGIGDGYLRIDGETVDLEPPGNAPPYLAYALLPPERVEMDPARFRFAVHAEAAGGAFARLLLGTDGVRDLARASVESRTDGSAAVPGLAAFWEEDRFYRNPHAVTRELTRLAADTLRIDWDARRKSTRPGLLPDDTTLVALRRRPAPEIRR
jgi:hypothetical protein